MLCYIMSERFPDAILCNDQSHKGFGNFNNIFREHVLGFDDILYFVSILFISVLISIIYFLPSFLRLFC